MEKVTVLCVVLWVCCFPCYYSSLLSDKCSISITNGGLCDYLCAVPPPQQGVKHKSLHIWEHNGMKSILKDEINR